MNLLVVFAVLFTIFAPLSWNVDCAPQHQFYSESYSSSSSNGGPATTYRMTNANGQRDYTINGRQVSESEFGRGTKFESGMDTDMEMGLAISMGHWPKSNN